MKRLTMKFGGTSMGSTDAMNAAASIVGQALESWDQIVVIVSAMSGVTDQLLQATRPAFTANGNEIQAIREELRARHVAVIEDLSLDAQGSDQLQAKLETLFQLFVQSCQALADHEGPDGRLLDFSKLYKYTHILWLTSEGMKFFEDEQFDFVLLPLQGRFSGSPYTLNIYLLNHPQWTVLYRDVNYYLYGRLY